MDFSMPRMKCGEEVKKMTMFRNFVGCVATCMVLKTGVSRSKLKDIYTKFNYGISDCKEISGLTTARAAESESETKKPYLIPDRFLILSPSYYSGNTLHNVYYPERAVVGKLEGNCGVYENKPEYTDPIKNFLPFLQVPSRLSTSC